jgi:hypothetical protein
MKPATRRYIPPLGELHGLGLKNSRRHAAVFWSSSDRGQTPVKSVPRLTFIPRTVDALRPSTSGRSGCHNHSARQTGKDET